MLDGYIQSGRFCEFLNGFIEICNEENAFDLWKHKDYGMSYQEFREQLLPSKKKKMPEKTAIEILKESFEILDDFKPKEGVN